jgi:putative N-acetylmannosamine-6-phosphate epimerase
MNRRRFLSWAAGLAGGAAGVRATAQRSRSAVRVRREAPVIERTEFDPKRPPRDMPPLTPPESGVCKTTFELAASLGYSAEPLSRTTARIYVDELDIVTRLRFDIYTVKGGPPKLRAHEEGHRAIGEHYYRDAEQIAEQIGRRLIGATFEGRGSDQESAQKDAFGQVVAEIERAYMARVRIPSAAANERFDVITNHGLNPIDEGEAIALALDGRPPP